MHDFANKTLTELIKVELNHDIIHGVFKPEQKLSIKLLTQHYNAGSSPIREALSRLVATNMIVSRGQKGFFTPTIGICDLHQLAQAQHALMPMTFGHLNKANITQAVQILEQLEQWHQSQPPSSHLWVEAVQQFYRSLATSCTSVYLCNYYQQISEHIERYQHYILIDNGNPTINMRPVRERQIITALQQQQWDLARELISKAQAKIVDTVVTQLIRLQTVDITSYGLGLNLQQWQSDWEPSAC